MWTSSKRAEKTNSKHFFYMALVRIHKLYIHLILLLTIHSFIFSFFSHFGLGLLFLNSFWCDCFVIERLAISNRQRSELNQMTIEMLRQLQSPRDFMSILYYSHFVITFCLCTEIRFRLNQQSKFALGTHAAIGSNLDETVANEIKLCERNASDHILALKSGESN